MYNTETQFEFRLLLPESTRHVVADLVVVQRVVHDLGLAGAAQLRGVSGGHRVGAIEVVPSLEVLLQMLARLAEHVVVRYVVLLLLGLARLGQEGVGLLVGGRRRRGVEHARDQPLERAQMAHLVAQLAQHVEHDHVVRVQLVRLAQVLLDLVEALHVHLGALQAAVRV